MEEESQVVEQNVWSVPWSQRDVWFGVGSLVLYMGVVIGGALLVGYLNIKMDIGFLLMVAELLLIVPVWFFTVRKYKIGWRVVGFRKFAAEDILLGFILMVGYLIFNGIFNFLLIRITGKTIQGDVFEQLAQIKWSVWLWIGGAVAAPIVEEVFFRGFVFGGLKGHMDWKWAALISSLLFGLMHGDLTAVLPASVIGFCFAFLYHKSHSIWPGIIIHVVNNAMAFLVITMLIKFGQI
jgi:membrane protease YdiL (CAAX protease family)